MSNSQETRDSPLQDASVLRFAFFLHPMLLWSRRFDTTGNVIKGWDIGVATMLEGEKCLLTCKPEYAYGDRGAGDKIKPGDTLEFEVRIDP